MSKKIISVILSIVLVLGCTAFAASAKSGQQGSYYYTSKTNSTLGKTNFTNKWKDRTSYKVNGNNYTFDYGYDTVAFNEDYMKDLHADANYNTRYYARIENTNTSNISNEVSGTAKTSSVSIRHTSTVTTVKYAVYARS